MATEYTSEQLQAMREFNEATRTIPLTEIVDRILKIAEDTSGADGELSPEACERLEALNLSLEQKTQAYHIVCRRLECDADACSSIANEMSGKAAAKINQAKRMKARLQAELERLGVQRIKTPTVTAYTQESESVECEDLANLPPEYVVTVEASRPDKKRMAEELRAGKELGFAWLKRATHLRFR
jgi:hypothetical protein